MGTVHHVLGTRTIHGDLVTEHFNKETKGTAGPFPVGMYLLKVNNRNTRTSCEKCSKLIIKTPERRY